MRVKSFSRIHKHAIWDVKSFSVTLDRNVAPFPKRCKLLKKCLVVFFLLLYLKSLDTAFALENNVFKENHEPLKVFRHLYVSTHSLTPIQDNMYGMYCI